MQIAITQDDWAKLTLPTRRELRRFIAEYFQAREEEGSELDESMYDLNDQLMERFMEGVAEKTKDFLRCFVGDGSGRIDELLEATGYSEFQQFRGIRAGTTRRIRKLFQDPDAYIIGWKDDEDDEWGGYYFVREGTRKALENYFN